MIDYIIAKCLLPSLYRQGLTKPETLIGKASRFTACEVVEGDYLEFGVFQGASLIASFKALENAFESRIAQSEGFDKQVNKNRSKIWNQMHFFGFDSFEGLPELEANDVGTSDFKKGMYACDKEIVQDNITNAGVPSSRITLIKGWFSDTCTFETAKKYSISKASIIWIDGDLYSSTRDVLFFVEGFLQDGTILIFDDWFSYKGNPSMGEQRAFYEWIETPFIKDNYYFHEYQRESWKRISFIVNKKK
mgnify:CR=1 FL=1